MSTSDKQHVKPLYLPEFCNKINKLNYVVMNSLSYGHFMTGIINSIKSLCNKITVICEIKKLALRCWKISEKG